MLAAGAALLAALAAVVVLWRRVNQLGRQQMVDEVATQEDFEGVKAAIAAIDAETTRLGQAVADEGQAVAGVADRVQKLIDQLNQGGGGINAADVKGATAALQAEVETLRQVAATTQSLNSQLAGIGADVNNPTPSAPPSA